MFFKYFPVILLFFIPIAFAAYTEKTVDGWFYANDTIRLSSSNISLKGASTQDSVAMTYNDRTVIVSNGTCEETSRFFFCIDNMKEGNFDYYWRVYRMQFHITVKEKLAKLEITRTVSVVELYSGQQTEVNLKVRNTGSFTATSLHLEDSFPGFFVVSADGCKRSDNAVLLDTTLPPDQEFSCKYILKAVDKTTLSSKAIVAFNNGKAVVTESSVVVSIKVYGDELYIDVPKNLTLELGEKKTIKVELNNSLPTDVFISNLELSLPYGLTISKFNFWTKINDYNYQFSGSITKFRTLELTFSGERMKRYIVPFRMDYEVATIRKSITKNMTVNVFSQNLTIDIVMPKVVNSTLPIDIKVNNPSSIQYASSIDTKVVIPCLNLSFPRKYVRIDPKEVLVLVSDNFRLPKDSKGCTVSVNIDYETQFGQVIKKSKSANFTVKTMVAAPINQPVAMKNESAQVQPEAKKEQFFPDFGLTFNRWWVIIPGAVIFLFIVMAFLKRKKRLVSREETKVVTKELQAPEEKLEVAAKKEPVIEKKPVEKKSIEKQIVEKKSKRIVEKKPAKVPKEKQSMKQPSYRF